MTATSVDTQAIVAGGGVTSTPVKLALNAATIRLGIQLKVTTTRASAPSVAPEKEKIFTLFWGYSNDDITLNSSLPQLLRNGVKTLTLRKNMDIDIQRAFAFDERIFGANCYFWFETPASSDAYSVVVQTCEIGS